MPCDGKHMNPSRLEQNSAEVRRHLREVGLVPYGKDGGIYGNVAAFDIDTAALCVWCSEHPDQIKAQSLELQIWWRDHQTADQAKADARVAHARLRQLQNSGLNKLTAEERKALGLEKF